MAEFHLRPKAFADLEEIWKYTVETWGEEQAETFSVFRRIRQRALPSSPARGTDWIHAQIPQHP